MRSATANIESGRTAGSYYGAGKCRFDVFQAAAQTLCSITITSVNILSLRNPLKPDFINAILPRKSIILSKYP
jgi:hypothetical protein